MKILDSREIKKRIGAKQLRINQIIVLALFADAIGLYFYKQYLAMQIINMIIVISLIVNAVVIMYKLLKYKRT